MKIWKRNNSGEWKCLQTFDFAPKMMECVALSQIPGTGVIMLAAAGVDLSIHLYVCKLTAEKVSTCAKRYEFFLYLFLISCV